MILLIYGAVINIFIIYSLTCFVIGVKWEHPGSGRYAMPNAYLKSLLNHEEYPVFFGVTFVVNI